MILATITKHLLEVDFVKKTLGQDVELQTAITGYEAPQTVPIDPFNFYLYNTCMFLLCMKLRWQKERCTTGTTNTL